MLTKAYIPYRGYYSTPFVRWQGSLANEHSIVLGANTSRRFFESKGWDPKWIEYVLVGSTVYVRGDTPVHSFLHELCHLICMDPQRRATLHREAGGTRKEEEGVCYLQVVLARDHLRGVGMERLLADMDAWGYNFVVGSAKGWFETDAADARQWLIDHGLLTEQDRYTGRLQGE